MSGFITVTVAGTKGSSPRDAGATMFVHTDRTRDTIGGGALEWEAIRIARDMLAKGTAKHRQTFPLGPDLGQCCGGTVTLDFIAGGPGVEPWDHAIWIWGAGHVGRAIAQVLAPFPDRMIALVDDHPDRMPDELPAMVQPLVARDMVRATAHAPPDGHHLILTYSHDIDLALCDALLRLGFASCGVIGSATKWARFRRRLASMGHRDAEISRIACPIGDPTLGKHPQAIAIGVATALLSSAAGVPNGGDRR